MKLSAHRVVRVSLLAATVFISACRREAPTKISPPVAGPPSGEVWISKEQLSLAQIDVAPLEEHDVNGSILASGRITFDDQKVAHVYSPVTGRVTRIDAKPGQRVKKGDALAAIVSPDIGQASSDLSKAQADVIAAEHDYRRKKDLFDQRAASSADLEISEDTFRKTKAEMGRAIQKARLLRSANVDAVSQAYTLTSPIDGEVIARTVNPGAEVQGQYGGGTAVELFTVGELDSVWVIFDVFEMDLHRLTIGSKTSVSVVAYPGRKFEGIIDWISGAIDPMMHTTKVRCALPNRDRALRPEMYATVNVSVGEARALAVPRTAIIRLDDQLVIFAERGEAPNGLIRFEMVPVQLDDSPGTAWLALEKGPPRGTRIVASGGIMLLGML